MKYTIMTLIIATTLTVCGLAGAATKTRDVDRTDTVTYLVCDECGTEILSKGSWGSKPDLSHISIIQYRRDTQSILCDDDGKFTLLACFEWVFQEHRLIADLCNIDCLKAYLNKEK